MFAMEGNLMRSTRSIHEAWSSAAGGGGTSSRLRATLLLLLPVALATILFVSTLGCANNPRLEELYNGKSCSAENVREYAREHHLSYEQALDELRKEDQQLWQTEEARQMQAVGGKQ